MRIYQDGQGINAIQILPRGDNPKLFTLGKFDRTKDDSGVFNFGDNEEVVGFYGGQNGDAISIIGFLTKNRNCVIEKLGENALTGGS